MHPLEVPMGLRHHTTVLAQSGDIEDVIPGAVRHGIFLTVPQLKALHGVYQFPLPKKGLGHGTDGSIVKRDYAEGLVQYLFKDQATSDMVDALLGRGQARLGTASKHSANIVSAFRSLAPEDQHEFQDLAGVAMEEEKLAEARAARADMSAPHSSPLHQTPKSLTQLLPVGAQFSCVLNRHPVLRRYQIFIIDKESRYLEPSI